MLHGKGPLELDDELEDDELEDDELEDEPDDDELDEEELRGGEGPIRPSRKPLFGTISRQPSAIPSTVIGGRKGL